MINLLKEFDGALGFLRSMFSNTALNGNIHLFGKINDKIEILEKHGGIIIEKLKSGNYMKDSKILMQLIKDVRNYWISYYETRKDEDRIKGLAALRCISNDYYYKHRPLLLEFKKQDEINEIKSIINNKGLLNACKVNFNNGKYWDSIFSAFRHLEVKLREKAELDANHTGTNLATKAFKPETGFLKIPICQNKSEEEGFHSILRGVIQFHRNVKSHREGIMDKETAMKIIGYVDYLLSMINISKKR